MLVTANGDNKKCEKNWLKKLGELQEFLRKSKGSYEGMQKKEPGLYYWYNRCHKARAHLLHCTRAASRKSTSSSLYE